MMLSITTTALAALVITATAAPHYPRSAPSYGASGTASTYDGSEFYLFTHNDQSLYPNSTNPEVNLGFAITLQWKDGSTASTLQFGTTEHPLTYNFANFTLTEGNLRTQGWESDDITSAHDEGLVFLHSDEPAGDFSIPEWNGESGYLAVNNTIVHDFWKQCYKTDTNTANEEVFGFVVPIGGTAAFAEECYNISLVAVKASSFDLAKWCPEFPGSPRCSTAVVQTTAPNTVADTPTSSASVPVVSRLPVVAITTTVGDTIPVSATSPVVAITNTITGVTACSATVPIADITNTMNAPSQSTQT